MGNGLMHTTYLPFTEEQVVRCFAPVGLAGKGYDPQKHLKHFLKSLKEEAKHAGLLSSGIPVTPQMTAWGRQMEKDERFWVAAALMGLYHAEPPAARATLFGELLSRCQLTPPTEFGSWAEALAGTLHLYFEVNLPSPPSYSQWLHEHVDQRLPIPYLNEAAAKIAEHPPQKLEGATKLDAMLLSADTGVAVAFEAKVLSDISTHIRFDAVRNQLARTIDVLMEKNTKLAPPLLCRRPEFTYVVLLTPEIFRGSSFGRSKGRLYGWLLPAYQDPGGALLGEHLPHRAASDLRAMAGRLGWATWEDCEAVLPGVCPWLPALRV